MSNRRKPRNPKAGTVLSTVRPAAPMTPEPVTGSAWPAASCDCLHPDEGGFCSEPAEVEAQWEYDECRCDDDCQCYERALEIDRYCFDCLAEVLECSNYAGVTLTRLWA